MLCALLLTIGCKLHEPEINGISIDKIREAKDIALQKDSGVHIASAFGARKNGEFMTDPDMTEVFKFIATAYDPYGPTDSIWELVCVDDEWNIITDSLQGMFEGIVVSVDLVNIEMDVCDAWDLLTEEHGVDSFHNWSLFQPLHPDFEHPFFFFATDTGSFIVNTITSEIEFDPR
ncbi:hypothetical protein JW879_00325 [candidate division WOR-3 bacterium]|nr:hypothetical protein [candidate division WOR-3 bacterium]